jgi:hypothetical protein
MKTLLKFKFIVFDSKFIDGSCEKKFETKVVFSNLVSFCRIHLFNYIHLTKFLETTKRLIRW